MPWTVNDGVRLHYAVTGTGPPLVMHVGFMGCLEDWRRPGSSYVAELKHSRRLILLDPRGQGRSDKPRDPHAYAMEHRTADVMAILDALGIQQSAFWGYSLGGRVAFELAMRYPDRLSGVIAGGANLYRQIDANADPLLTQLQEGMDTVVSAWERGFGPLPTAMRDRWLENDALALAAAWKAPGQPSNVVGALADLTTPLLVYAGSEDHMLEDILRPVDQVRGAELVVIDGLNHMEAFYRQDRVVPHVMRFLERL